MDLYFEKYDIDINKLQIEMKELTSDPKVIGIKQYDNGVLVYINSPLTAEENTELQQTIDNHDPTPTPELRVYRSLPKDMNPLISDFSILGFRKVAPHYDRGRKIKAEYKCVDKDEIIVEKIFSDIRDVNTGILTGLQVTFNWYDENNNIGLTKTEIVKQLNKAQAETIERQRRERAIDFLISEARNTPNEPFISALMLHYEVQINHFKTKSADDFATAIKNETDPTILAILQARVPFASDHSYTVPVKESILYQIGTLSEAELLTTLLPA